MAISAPGGVSPHPQPPKAEIDPFVPVCGPLRRGLRSCISLFLPGALDICHVAAGFGTIPGPGTRGYKHWIMAVLAQPNRWPGILK